VLGPGAPTVAVVFALDEGAFVGDGTNLPPSGIAAVGRRMGSRVGSVHARVVSSEVNLSTSRPRSV
jgi:hypothetical protein